MQRQDNLPGTNWERKLKRKGYKNIAGIDEAGRGPLAGPVVAAAVIFPDGIKQFGVNDSKKISAAHREEIYDLIFERAIAIGIGVCSEKVIDKINILQATHRAMKKAVASLKIQPEFVLIDGRDAPRLNIPYEAIVKGDTKCFSIAAASIIAKVTRDRMMIRYDKKYPGYFFARHKGYPTKLHIQAIEELGFCPIHRKSFQIKKLQPNE